MIGLLKPPPKELLKGPAIAARLMNPVRQRAKSSSS